LFSFTGGYLTKITRMDSLNHIVRASAVGDGVAIIKMEYDNNGNQIKKSVLDETANPTKDHEGVSTTVKTYTVNNMQTSTAFFDEFGKPVKDRSEIHRYVYVNDSVGQTIQESFFDNEGNPIKDYTNDVFMIKTSYDSNGLEISESYWKDKDIAMPRWNGIYEQRLHYNEDGQDTEYDYYDQNGNLMKSDEGFSVCKLLLDQNGTIYARQYLFNDELVNKTGGISHGFSVIRYEYDSLGKIIQILFFGDQHEAVNATVDITDPVQVHRIQFFYKGSRVIEQWYYTIYGKEPFLKLDCLKNEYLNPNGIGIGHKNAN
jgi:hypothetical protein